ncbi:hypothetical protein HMPREF1433_01499 [Helicobacter pylori GAMchJs117Ai]|nr:hypothetical protein HMPREF1393_00030 [Helicobacter pylori GAM103Bi]EMJ39087.1 hypothetical protein HMPREF1433_01499 [Helicobacter pylori GAMchJs117Ai]
MGNNHANKNALHKAIKTRLGFKLVSFFFNGLCYTNKIQI